MIPVEQAKLAEALVARVGAMEFEVAVEIAGRIIADLRKDRIVLKIADDAALTER